LQTAFRPSPPDDLPVDLAYSFDPRPVLKSEPGTIYFHNSFYTIRTHWPSLRQFNQSSVARAALDIRLSVIRSKQPSAVRKALQFMEAHITDHVMLGAPGTRLDFLPMINPWTTFAFNDLDFSAALVDSNKFGQSGKVVFTHPWIALSGHLKIEPFFTSIKDGNGGYWLRSNLSASRWKAHGG